MCYNELHTAVYILHFNSWKQRKQWGRDAAFEKKRFQKFLCVLGPNGSRWSVHN